MSTNDKPVVIFKRGITGSEYAQLDAMRQGPDEPFWKAVAKMAHPHIADSDDAKKRVHIGWDSREFMVTDK